jgi:anthranilate/para-aminobenzoate synthase component I
VTEAFAVERYSHVMHTVSNVEGVLKEGMTNPRRAEGDLPRRDV